MESANLPQTILHVEDDPNDVTLIGRAFRKAGLAHEIQVVNDGEQAIAYLKGSNQYADRGAFPLPALVLLDLKLPRKSGLEVIAWLRTQSHLKRLPIIMLTSSKQRTDINQAYDLGVNCYLVKPVDFEKLSEMVKVLDQFWLNMIQRPLLEP